MRRGLLVIVLAIVAVMAVVMALGLSVSSAQSPTPAPTQTATPQPSIVPSPTPSPVASPAEPAFNWAIVKEVVVPLIGDDGRIHYVTLSQDTAGVVRVRLSLFYFSPGSYEAALFNKGDCAAVSRYGVAEMMGATPFDLRADAGTSLVLFFFNTRQISIAGDSPNSIYDADGASLAVLRVGQTGKEIAACAALSAPLAPATGNSIPGESRDRFALGAVVLGAALVATGLVLSTRLNRR